MELATQFFGAFRPLVLTVIGVIVSIWPPRAEGKRHWLWVAAFLVVGLPTAIATFLELRGTDYLLAQIWQRLSGSEISSNAALQFIVSHAITLSNLPSQPLEKDAPFSRAVTARGCIAVAFSADYIANTAAFAFPTGTRNSDFPAVRAIAG